MENKEYSRKKFIGKCLRAGSMILGGAVFLNSCDSKASGEKAAKQNSPVKSCEDLSDVSAEEIEKRKKFGYVSKSTVPGNNCGNCGLFIPPKTENDCGGCLLFKGPVEADGHCVQYAPKA